MPYGPAGADHGSPQPLAELAPRREMHSDAADEKRSRGDVADGAEGHGEPAHEQQDGHRQIGEDK